MSELKNPYRHEGRNPHPNSLMYKLAAEWDIKAARRPEPPPLLTRRDTLRPEAARLPASTVAKATKYQAVRRSLSQTPRVSQPELSVTVESQLLTEESPPQTPTAPAPL